MIEEGLTELIMGDIVHGYNKTAVEIKYKMEGVSSSKIKECWKEANKQLGEASADMAANLREMQLQRYLDIYKEARDIGDLKTSNSVLQSVDKLYGLQSQKLDIDVKEYIISFE